MLWKKNKEGNVIVKSRANWYELTVIPTACGGHRQQQTRMHMHEYTEQFLIPHSLGDFYFFTWWAKVTPQLVILFKLMLALEFMPYYK